MNIKAYIDENQNDNSDRAKLAICPNCGQKLFEVSVFVNRGAFRVKCRRCKQYILVKVIN